MKKFKPAFGLQNRHLQTIYSSFFRKNKNLDIEIETFTLSEGDFVEDYWLDKLLPNSTPIVDLFLDKGIIVSTQEKNQSSNKIYYAKMKTTKVILN